jgi:hypothetical protein
LALHVRRPHTEQEDWFGRHVENLIARQIGCQWFWSRPPRPSSHAGSVAKTRRSSREHRGWLSRGQTLRSGWGLLAPVDLPDRDTYYQRVETNRSTVGHPGLEPGTLRQSAPGVSCSLGGGDNT